MKEKKVSEAINFRRAVRVYDSNGAWTGAEPISLCYQEIPLNFRVLACDNGGGNYVTSDGVNITDVNLVHIDNTSRVQTVFLEENKIFYELICILIYS